MNLLYIVAEYELGRVQIVPEWINKRVEIGLTVKSYKKDAQAPPHKFTAERLF